MGQKIDDIYTRGIARSDVYTKYIRLSLMHHRSARNNYSVRPQRLVFPSSL